MKLIVHCCRRLFTRVSENRVNTLIRSNNVTSRYISSLYRRSRRSNVEVRVRFAPSPTGFLHLGGLRTALINYLFAVKNGGKFILRIEDTDRTRIIPNAVESIEEDLNWLGIIPDEGPSTGGLHGPYIQSERYHLYTEKAKTLIDSRKAYECFCSEKRLNILRKEAERLRETPRYDNKCRRLSKREVQARKDKGEKYCIRFKMVPQIVALEDLIHGLVHFDLTGDHYEGDPVIIKSDGFPTYHFANIVDDHLMQISHVFRGFEWQSSTPKHLQLYSAFEWEPPKLAHLPLVINKDGTKLSKRQNDISIRHYRQQNYYPSALSNFVTKSGGGFEHQIDKIFSIPELANQLDIKRINSKPCGLDFNFLDILNSAALKTLIETDCDTVARNLKAILPNKKVSLDRCKRVVVTFGPRINRLKDLIGEDFDFLWKPPDPTFLKSLKHQAEIKQLGEKLKTVEVDFENTKELNRLLKKFCAAKEINYRDFMSDLRLVLSGLEKGPPVAEICVVLGRHNVIDRIELLERVSPDVGSGSCSVV